MTSATTTFLRVVGGVAGWAGVAFAGWVAVGFGSTDPRLIVGLALLLAAPGLIVSGAVLGLPWHWAVAPSTAAGVLLPMVVPTFGRVDDAMVVGYLCLLAAWAGALLTRTVRRRLSVAGILDL